MFAAVTSLLSADATLWGPVESGLQLGIDVTATSDPTFRILLKNAGAEPRDLVIGHEGSQDLYNIELTTRSPEQQEQPVFDSTALKAVPASLILPIIGHLQPGEIREFVYPLSQLICVVHRRDVPFRTLLEHGYWVRASFDFPFARLTTPDLSLDQ